MEVGAEGVDVEDDDDDGDGDGAEVVVGDETSGKDDVEKLLFCFAEEFPINSLPTTTIKTTIESEYKYFLVKLMLLINLCCFHYLLLIISFYMYSMGIF